MLVAKSLCEFEVALGLFHVVAVEAERCQSIIAGKQQLRLASLARDIEGLVVVAERKIRRVVALMDLSKHCQGHREVLALVEGSVDFNRLLGGWHAFLGAAGGERAACDRQVGVEPCLEAEIADAGCNLEAEPADRDRARRINDRVEHAKIRIGPAHHALQPGRFGDRHAALDLVHRLGVSPEPGEGDTLGVKRFCDGPGRFERDLLARRGRTRLRIPDRFVRPFTAFAWSPMRKARRPRSCERCARSIGASVSSSKLNASA